MEIQNDFHLIDMIKSLVIRMYHQIYIQTLLLTNSDVKSNKCPFFSTKSMKAQDKEATTIGPFEKYSWELVSKLYNHIEEHARSKNKATLIRLRNGSFYPNDLKSREMSKKSPLSNLTQSVKGHQPSHFKIISPHY